MQLNKRGTSRFAAAAFSLLGVTTAPARSDGGGDWTFDSSTLFYAEGAGRVKVFEPKASAAYDLGGGSSLAATATVDVLSGATPNGAAPYSRPQTFFQPHSTSGSSGSSSSGTNSTYTTGAYELPKDPAFRNLRGALDVDYSFVPAVHQRMDLSGSVSLEDDYVSVGAGGHWSREFNKGSTTLATGFNVSSDFVSPIGGVFEPLSQMNSSISTGPSTKEKLVEDFLIGGTQLISPRSFVQVNYSLSHSSGYLNDPYKIVSVVDASAAPQYYIYESRPGSRLKNSIFTHYRAKALGADVFDASYRFMVDDWGIKSHTVDLSYRAYFSGAYSWLEPNVRWYRQNAAKFFRTALDTGEAAGITHVSADQRLGAFSAYTAGFGYGNNSLEDYPWSVRLEYYRQLGKVAGLPAAAGSALSQFDIAPSLAAGWLIFSIGFR